MTEHPTYIRALDEGHTAIVTNLPREDEGNTALMVNPKASANILIDSAFARAIRIESITRMFCFLDQGAISEIPESAISDLGCTLNGMAHDVARLLEAAQAVNSDQTRQREAK